MDLSVVPDFKLPTITPGMLNVVVIAMILSLVFFVLMKLSRNRIYVDIYEKVKSGYVSRPGRYRFVYDKHTKMHSLVSMFGGRRIPAFESEYFQKVGGTPFIGIMRQIKLVKINRYTFYPIIPPKSGIYIATAKDYNSLTWVRTEILRTFEKRIKSGQFLYMLSVAAPSIVILSAIAFLCFAVYTDQYLLNHLVNRIDEITRALEAVVVKAAGG